MTEEVYTDPNAKAAVLGMGNSPENQQIAAQIMNEGLANTLQTAQTAQTEELGTGIPTGSEMLQMPPVPLQGQTGQPSDTDTLESIKRTEQMEMTSQWIMLNENEKVPWNQDLTWGQYLERIYEAAENDTAGSGQEAVSSIVQQQMEIERQDADPNDLRVQNIPEMETLPLPGNNEAQIAAAAQNAALPLEATDPSAAPVADQQGIMAAANGGLVGYARGGPVGEEEFMSVLNAEAQNAGVSPDQMAAVTDMATNVTGGPMAANDNVMDTGIMQNVDAVEATDEDLSGIGSLVDLNAELADAGEEGLVHATEGELIFDPSRLNEPDQRMLMAALETAGIDPAAATVGNEANILNQMTGLPAFGFFSKVWKKITSVPKKIIKTVKKGVKKVGGFLKKHAGTILGIAGAMTGNPWLAALGSGIGSLIEGKPIQQALLSAGMSFAGTKWVGPWIGKQLQAAAPGTFGTSVSDTFGIGEGLAGQGKAQLAMEKAAHNAATNAALTAAKTAAPEAILKTATEDAIAAAIKTVSGAGINATTEAGKAVIAKGASDIAQRAVADVASGAVTRLAGATIPERIFTSAATRAFAQPVGQLAGSAIAGGLQSSIQPMVEASMFGDPNAEAEALAAWNQRYNYVPSAQELYEFYTNEYIPNQQVDPGMIGGTPGYQTAAMGNLGMNFAPPPPPGTAGLLPNSLGIFNAAGGGYVNGIGGPRTDSNLARLSDGEFVMTEQAVRGAGNGDRREGAARMLGIMQGFERSAA